MDKKQLRIMVIPDTQAKPGDDFSFMSHIGEYMCEKRPDVVIHLGDLADMESLSSYDQGKKSFEGRRYSKDVEAAIQAQSALFKPLFDLQIKQRINKQKVYDPTKFILLGNHEARIARAVNDDPKLDGLLSTDDLRYKDFFDEVYPFLEVVVIEGVAFSHYFTTGQMGRPASSAAAQLNKKHQSCIAGHQQGLQIATGHRADGKRLTSIIAGSCYEHNEDYLGPQGNQHWRGIMMLHSVEDGQFDMVPVPLKYLKEKYGEGV